MPNSLDVFVAANYGALLAELRLTHVKYFLDTRVFGNEIDRYRNDRMIVDFIKDRGEDAVQVMPILRQSDRFDLTYLLSMLEPQHVPKTTAESLRMFVVAAPKIYAIFESEYYACYRRAYHAFENCRNLWGIESGESQPVAILG